MLGEAAGAPPLTRDRLSGLAARFPDTPAGAI
ncbi:phage tail assembly chaperone [Rhodobacter capsulatus]